MIVVFFAFTAFILAFLPLIKRIDVFRLNLSLLTQKGLWWILIITGFIALIKILIDYNPSIKNISIPILENFSNSPANYKNLLICYGRPASISLLSIGHSISFFWYVVLVIVISYVFRKIFIPAKFSKRNSEIYFSESGSIIAHGKKEDINSLANETGYSISKIFKYAAAKNNETSKHAYRLIELFSDNIFCKAIVNHNPRTLYEIFKSVTENSERYSTLGINFITRLISLMITEPDSILNREEPYYGLGHFGECKELIFGNIHFLKSKYYPLSRWYVINNKNLNSRSIKKYHEIIIFSLEKYIHYQDDSPHIFLSALENISSIINSNLCSLEKYDDKKRRFSLPATNLTACLSGVISLIHFIALKIDLFPQTNAIETKNYSFYKNDRTIYGALANGIYQIIESFSKDSHDYDRIHLLIMEIYNTSKKSNTLKAIQDRLTILLKRKIQENLNELLYPSVTACLIYSFGLCEPEKTPLEIHQFLLMELKKNFIAAYNANPNIAIDMIPDDTEYDHISKKLIRKDPRRWIRNKTAEELKLDVIKLD